MKVECLRKNLSLLVVGGTILLAVLGAVWSNFLDHGPLAKKTEVKKLEEVVIALSKCVDSPQYVTVNESEQPSISYDCYERVLEVIYENDDQ